MRFYADGPLIPDELLIARDENRVVFFCGAGVSKERAGLSLFFELANVVIKALKADDDEPAYKILKEAQDIVRRKGVNGIIPADRIFGLLERSFDVQIIEAEVAKALKPSVKVDLSAHKIILDLARAPDGNVRIVTTNFDLLFEACDPSLPQSRPPRLPDPLRGEEFKGVIHLHGHVDQDYSKAVGDGFVLSSRGFGRAYLAEGWATSFIKSVLEKYVVVFIGYTADDPPVQYLLEALNTISKTPDKIYAFQDGPADEAEAKWGHKGVQPIAYDASRNHSLLWKTLGAWAKRAKDHDAWYDKIISMARQGPETLAPHERGQVAHLVSFAKGARLFADSIPPPPAEWLCVFDPARRYGNPGRLGSFYEEGPYFDPFDAYGIDTDPSPSKIELDDYHTKREIPKDVLDIFAATRRDVRNIKEESYSTLRGAPSVGAPRLPDRLWHLGLWISKISDQPATVWWASHQTGVHAAIQNQIQHHLERRKRDCSKEIRQAWRHLFNAWEKKKNDFDKSRYQFKIFIDIDGWTNQAVKKFAMLCRPYLKVEKPSLYGPKPPDNKEGTRIEEMICLDVEYPWPGIDNQIPDEFLVHAVREFRKNLESAVYLENEIGGYGLHQVCPIESDLGLEGDPIDRTYGISMLFLFFVNLMRRLIAKNPAAARQEFQAWWAEEQVIFDRLRIWMAGHKELFSANESSRIISNLTDQSFWNGRHQRDLLLVLRKRWSDFPEKTRKRLEKKLLKGPPRCEEKRSDFIERRAWKILDRIHWLKDQGCRFAFDIDKKTEKLRKSAPKWQFEYASKAAASLEGMSVVECTETDYSALFDESKETLLDKAEEFAKTSAERFVTRDPFTGLAAEKPEIAIAALTYEAKIKKYREWAWRKFLTLEVRKTDPPEIIVSIADLILNMPVSALKELMYPVSEWIFNLGKLLFNDYPEQFEKIWKKLIDGLNTDPSVAKSSRIRGGKDPDWAREALHSPIGNLVKTLMLNPAITDLTPGKGFPSPWIDHIEDLLALKGDLRCYTIALLTDHLNLFCEIDPEWTGNHLIAVLDQRGNDKKAFWAGFFWHAQVPGKKLYLQLKPFLLRLASFSFEEQHSGIKIQVLSGILLAGWVTTDPKTGARLITNDEMRKALRDSDEAFRLKALWHLERAIAAGKTSREKKNHEKNLFIFLEEVWPRQKKIKSQKISEALLEIAFSSTADFSKMVDLILPLMTMVGRFFHAFYMLGQKQSEIIKKNPESMLTVLHEILSENKSEWPFGIEKIIDQIGAANPKLLKDSRLLELKNRLNSAG